MPQDAISPVQADDVSRLVEVWEASVRATHDFLSEADIEFFRPLIRDGLFGAMELACVRDERDDLVGFAGVAGGKLEATFHRRIWVLRG